MLSPESLESITLELSLLQNGQNINQENPSSRDTRAPLDTAMSEPETHYLSCSEFESTPHIEVCQ